jgi:hypothetical protein
LEGDFDSLPVPAKDFTLLNAVVTEKPYDGLRQYGLPLEIQQISEAGCEYTEENEDWRRLEGTVGFYDNYIEALDNRKKEPFFITKFSQNHIEGTIDVAGSRMLFFSIPYSEGWTLTVDDNLTSVDKVNIGFIGAQIGAGKHTIKLDYFLPGLFIGGIMSAAGCVIFIVLAWNTASISLRKNSRQAQ